MEGKMFVLLVVLSVALVYAVPSIEAADKSFKGDKAGCVVSEESGTLACKKELTDDCDADEGNTTTPTATTPPPTPTVTASATATTKATTVSADTNDEDEDECKVTADVEFIVSSIKEFANGTAITTVGHSIQTPMLVPGDVEENVDIPNSDSLKSTKLRLVHDDDKLAVDVYIATADGKITIDGEEQEIKKDMMKFSLEVSNWQFCTADDCDGAVGDALEVEVEIKSRDTPVVDADDDTKVELGGDAILQLSKKVKLDDTWADIGDGYPKIETRNGKHYLLIGFNKFTTKAYYDPTVDFGDWAHDGNGPISGAVTSYVTSSMACLLTVLAAMFV